jgi:hypothetical protein
MQPGRENDPVTSSAAATHPTGRDAIAGAARALRRYELPPEEISAVLGADDPELVRRYMELHRERLEERLLDRLRALASLERVLVQAILTREEGVPRKGRGRG